MLEIQGLFAGYGEAAVLTGVDCTAAAGAVTALMGRNGVGKTTLCRACVGLLPVTAGTVRIGGTDVTGWPAHRIARHGVGYVPQGRGTFDGLTVEDNLRLSSHGAVLRSTWDWFPPLYDLRGRRAGTLSGGQQQMLAIARALARAPRLLILDEPSEGLQPSVVHAIGAILARVAGETGSAVLLVEQSIDLVRATAADCAFLVDGRIAETVPAAGIGSGAVQRHLAF